MEQPGLKLELMGDAGISGSSLARFTTTPTLEHTVFSIIYLKGRAVPFAGSSPDAHSGQGRVRLKPGAQDCDQLSHMDGR